MDVFDSVYNRGFKLGVIAGKEEAEEEAYEKGLEDAWECAIHCIELGYGAEILKQYSASEAIEKLKKAREQNEDIIRIGDELTDGEIKIVCIEKPTGNFFTGMSGHGDTGVFRKGKWRKTGKHYDAIEEILNALKGDLK